MSPSALRAQPTSQPPPGGGPTEHPSRASKPRARRVLRIVACASLLYSGLLSAADRAAGHEPAAAATLATFRGSPGLSEQALAAAVAAVERSRARGIAGRRDRLALIDFSLPSTEPRFWVLDLDRGKVLFRELVAHGSGSGDNYATRFSNLDKSRQSSLGLFLTADTYEGANGYSLRLRGLDPGVNNLALERKIVIHGAWYVSAEHAERFGRLGRSWGCPALPLATAATIIDAIKDGTFLYAFHPGDSGNASDPANPAKHPPGAAAANRRRPQEKPAIG